MSLIHSLTYGKAAMHTANRDILYPCLASCLCLALMACANRGRCYAADESLLENGSFERWVDGLPTGWKVDIGARNGANQPISHVRQIAGPAILLRGDAKTMAWRSLSQDVAVTVGKSYRLEFDARSKGVQREGAQHDNCYVGWLSLDAAGKVVGRAIEDISAGAAGWKHFAVDYAIPAQAKTTSVSVFLSKTGLLGVKDVTVVPVSRVKNLLSNGSLETWTDDVPNGWKVDVGARNGADEPLSTLKRWGKAGVVLAGDKNTMAWRSLSQGIAMEPGKTYSLVFEASTADVRREGRQFDNCYVGVMSFDEQGDRLDMVIKDLSKVKVWKKQRLRFTPPANTKKTDVLIFLSKSGSLKVKDIFVGEAIPRRPFR